MSKVFKVTPKGVRRVNGAVFVPEMSVIVVCKRETVNPFGDGGKEVAEAYQRLFGSDYMMTKLNAGDFNYVRLD